MSHSGYEKERFVGLNFDQFDCIICSEVVLDPVECDGCGKLFCKICINDWIRKNPAAQCPNRCTSKIMPIHNKGLIRVYNLLKIHCSNPKCGEVLTLGLLKEHEEKCLKVKCWNFEVCQNVENEAMKGERPLCSKLCESVYLFTKNFGDNKKMYEILNNFISCVSNNNNRGGNNSNGSNTNFENLAWDKNLSGTGIESAENGTSVFLREQAYVFRTIIGNEGFSSGVHYWEIIADSRTENEIKVGISSSKNFDFNSAFCDHSFGWAYYGLGQLRHGSNATGPQYGKRFKKDGILGIYLDMNKGTLSFALNGENMGVAFDDPLLKQGTYYPAVSLLHCAGCKIRGGVPIPSYFK